MLRSSPEVDQSRCQQLELFLEGVTWTNSDSPPHVARRNRCLKDGIIQPKQKCSGNDSKTHVWNEKNRYILRSENVLFIDTSKYLRLGRYASSPHTSHDSRAVSVSNGSFSESLAL